MGAHRQRLGFSSCQAWMSLLLSADGLPQLQQVEMSHIELAIVDAILANDGIAVGAHGVHEACGQGATCPAILEVAHVHAHELRLIVVALLALEGVAGAPVPCGHHF